MKNTYTQNKNIFNFLVKANDEVIQEMLNNPPEEFTDQQLFNMYDYYEDNWDDIPEDDDNQFFYLTLCSVPFNWNELNIRLGYTEKPVQN